MSDEKPRDEIERLREQLAAVRACKKWKAQLTLHDSEHDEWQEVVRVADLEAALADEPKAAE